MDYQQFLTRLAEIKAMGFVPSHRVGDTGIGKTLEDLLGIKENNIPGPDFSIYELKGYRIKSKSMLSLFTKAPHPRGANKALLEGCGYPTRKGKNNFSLRNNNEKITKYIQTEGEQETSQVNNNCAANEKELHIDVSPLKINSRGLKLGVRDNRLYFDNDKGIQAYYENDYLKEAFESKYPNAKLIWVLAESKGHRSKESFHFVEAYRLADGFSFERFSDLIMESKIKVELRLGHNPNGTLHDHGTGFRILPKYFPQCFTTIEKIL